MIIIIKTTTTIIIVFIKIRTPAYCVLGSFPAVFPDVAPRNVPFGGALRDIPRDCCEGH